MPYSDLYDKVSGRITLPDVMAPTERSDVHGEAVAHIIQAALEDAGRTQAWLGVRVAELEGRDEYYRQPAVSGWLKNIAGQPPARIFLIEKALGMAAGSLSRLLGYLPTDAVAARSVPEAVEADARLGEYGRQFLLDAYRTLIERQDGSASNHR